MTKIEYQITAPHFCAGVTVVDDFVLEAAPILKWTRTKRWAEVRSWAERKGYTVEEVPDESGSRR